MNRTKYRLTKGDTQLSMQYLKQKPSYHIPELLSDICFTVYRARQESKETLSKYVRAKWVPEEYPTSIARLYEWTPDECIPEFYEDPKIFKSIHQDMSDLQLPSFINSSEEFIKWHRNFLESEEISSTLHQWIDLTFGYKLSGKAAIDALNVHLNFIDPPGKEKFIGPVQLFTTPHPKRQFMTAEEDLTKSYSNPFDNSNIYCKKSKRFNKIDEDSSFTEMFKKILNFHHESNQYKRKSMQSIGITIIELVLSQHCRDLSPTASFEERFQRAQNILLTQSGEIPRYLLKPLQNLFSQDTIISLPIFTNPIDTYFNLSHNMIFIFEKLQQYHFNDSLMKISIKHGTLDCGDEYFRNKIYLLKDCIDIPNMGNLWLQFFVELIDYRRLAATACYHLLPKLAKYYKKEHLLKYVKNIQSLIDYRTPNIIKLLDTQFLLSLSMAFETQNFLEYFVPPILEMLIPTHDNLYKAVKEIVLWIARRYGPILTASAITSKLLCLLPLCFTEENQRKIIGTENSLSYEVVGDKQCKNVLNCLVEIAIMFGPAFITSQYLPFCADVFEQAKGRTIILPAWESAMIASAVCLKTIVDCLTDKQLMDQLELDEIFNPNFALLLLHIFSFTCGRQFTLSIIQNKDLILELEKKGDVSPVLPEISRRCEESLSPPASTILSSSLPHSYSSGNRLAMFTTGSGSNGSPSASFDSFQESCSLCVRVNDDSPTHLQGTWVDHFRAVITSTTSLIPFDQIQLGTFSGHSSTIKKIVVLDNENSFITASSDKTIKLWSLKNFVDVGTSQLCYDRHTKSIQDVIMLQSEGKIVSTDGTIHIWDPFCEKTLQKLNWQDNGIDLVANNLSVTGKHKFHISSHASTMIISYDIREMDWSNRIITCPPSESCQGVRTFSISPNGNLIASALSNGCVSVIDIRIGKFLGFAAVSDAEITQLEWLTNEMFVITSSDLTSKIFDITPQMRVIGRLIEPASIIYAPSLREYITVQPSNRFRFYADGEFRNEIKLHSDFIAGTVTAINYMNLNKMFLIGSNTGMIRLAC
uniref:BEACH domain-containing protein n=1 Tax=Panagrolaimus superbus TaxID=310955 RepID=A0A914YZH0_9BILA